MQIKSLAYVSNMLKAGIWAQYLQDPNFAPNMLTKY